MTKNFDFFWKQRFYKSAYTKVLESVGLTYIINNLTKILAELSKKFQTPYLLFDAENNLKSYMNHDTGRNFESLPALIRICAKGITDLTE